MRKSIIFISVVFIMLIRVSSASGQDSTRLNIVKYLIKVGDLSPTNDKDKYTNDIYIVELTKLHKDENRRNGIFKFGTYSDHSYAYILLRDEKYQILDLQKLDQDLMKVLAFIRKNKIPSSEALKYIEATIKVYQNNLKAIPWTE